MWMSMTGFGRGEFHGNELSVATDIRSVNHRYLDVHVRCPAKYLPWETRVRGLVREALSRGKVDVFLSVREWGKAGTAVRVNRGLLASFRAEVESIRGEAGLAPGLSVGDLLHVPDLFVFSAEGADPAEENWALAEKSVRAALSMLQNARREEGDRLRAVIREGVGRLREAADAMGALAGENKENAVARFKERIGAIAGETGIEPARIMQEAAYLVDRLDITEECDRMRSHLAGLSRLLDGPAEAVGKRFDFLVQELFRELTTAANKSSHTGISALAVDAKTELEKIREQIQNVE